jgi:hypothetical protein
MRITQISIAVIILFALSSLQLIAQESAIQVYGKMKLEKGSLDGTIEVFIDGVRDSRRKVSGSGKFNYVLDANKEYEFSFSQEGYVTKKISFNTTIPAERASEGFAPFEFQVTLFKQYEGVNFVVFNQPVGKIRYSEEMGDFDYDTDYSKSIQERLEEAAKEVEKKSKEEDKMEKEQEKVKPEPKAPPPAIKQETSVAREEPPTKPKRPSSPPPPPPPNKKHENMVVLHSYTVGEMGYPNLSAYGFINFGDGAGRREITKEQFEDYAKLYH